MSASERAVAMRESMEQARRPRRCFLVAAQDELFSGRQKQPDQAAMYSGIGW
jgi:hypothetical protein